MQVIIPMAGAGTRFDAPCKPLIEIQGKPMFQIAIEGIGLPAEYCFVVLKQHVLSHKIDEVIDRVASQCDFVLTRSIVVIDKVTRGCLETCLIGARQLNRNDSVIICDCDQYNQWNPHDFTIFAESKQVEGIICTFNSRSLAHSYLELNSDCTVVRTVEKQAISRVAATGLYYWQSTRQFIWCAGEMIDNNQVEQGEFYVCPCYNNLITSGGTVLPYPIIDHVPLGTPEEVELYLDSKKN